MSLTKLILKSTTTVHDIVEMLDRGGLGVLPVLDESETLIGIVTDGDIRRALLKDSLDVDHIINKNPKTLSSRTPKAEILRTLRKLHLRHMPIVDEKGRLVDLVFLENLAAEPKLNRVIIMAGGLGSRLGALTQDIPKPMLPVNGRPILEHIIENLKFQGFFQFMLCLNYKAEVIREYFGNGNGLGVEIDYTIESKRLGTAGALSLINVESWKNPCLVLNADIMTNLDFDELLKFHTASGASATMCIKPQTYEIPYACIEFSDNMDLTGLVEKPKINNYINAGIYVLNPEVFTMVPKDQFFDMPALFQTLVAANYTTKVFRFEDYWIDIGQPLDYSRVKEKSND